MYIYPFELGHPAADGAALDQVTPPVPPVGAAMAVVVKVRGLPVRLPELAVTVFTPAAAPSLRIVAACPCAFVTTWVALKLPPPPLNANVTVTPATGCPLALLTCNVRGVGNGWLTVPIWLFPLTMTSLAAVGAAAAVAVAPNEIGLPLSVPEVAVTVLAPAVAPSVSVADASPWLLVTACVALSVPPPAVATKVILTPETGLPLTSLAWTTNGFDKAAPAAPL
jgi:hypothetical protein